MARKAKDTQARVDRLLLAVGQACKHEVGRRAPGLAGIPLSCVLDKRGVRQGYRDKGMIDTSRIVHDLNLLAQDEYVDFDRHVGPQDSYKQPTEGLLCNWPVWLRSEGLKRLVEVEKPYWRRVHDGGPGTFWLILVAVFSVLVSITALIISLISLLNQNRPAG